ncbi:MAG TPA: sulfotransferase [Arenimonas sp.]|nr:sulfotransferase [Arenimonas sp.]
MPRINFLIGGVQKAGTTALARYLERHPDIALPAAKEAHVFDAPDYDECWSPEQVDACFAGAFVDDKAARCVGDATPITLFHRRFVERVLRYNPAMRWVVLLRDPVQRAISHYHMQRARGAEPLPLLAALLAEPWRLRRHREDFSRESPLRHQSYMSRGRYGAQLDALYAHFPREQVMLLRSDELASDPSTSVARVLGFLGLSGTSAVADFPRHFEGNYASPPPWSPSRLWIRWCLRHDLAAVRDSYGIDWRPQRPSPGKAG